MDEKIYTPEEMFDYCQENGLLRAVNNAMQLNDVGFEYCVLDWKVEEKPDGIYATAPDKKRVYLGKDRKDLENGIDIEGRMKEFAVCCHHDDMCCVFSSNLYLFTSEHCSNKKDRDSSNRALSMGLLKTPVLAIFLEAAGVDTVPKLKRFLKRSNGIMKAICLNQELPPGIEVLTPGSAGNSLTRETDESFIYLMDTVKMGQYVMPQKEYFAFIDEKPWEPPSLEERRREEKAKRHGNMTRTGGWNKAYQTKVATNRSRIM